MFLLETMRELLATPAVLLGLVTMLGLILQKKTTEYVIKGTAATIAGFLILTAGTSFLQNGALADFGVLFNFDFHIQGVIPNMEAVSAVGMEKYATEISLIMCFGMLANLMIARFSSLHYIFLTGHHTLYMACLLAVVMHVAGLNGVTLILASSLYLGVLMAVMPAAAAPVVKKITGNERVALGHFSTIGYLLAAAAAKGATASARRKGKTLKSTEDLVLPAGLGFMRDTTASISIVMTVLFLIITGIAQSRPGFSELDTAFVHEAYKNWILYALISGVEFAAGIYIILAGVRMIIGEIVPAFRGIAKYLVPHARPAIDCPILFSYAPNAVLIGFLSSFAGGIVVMIALMSINQAMGVQMLAVIVPGVVAHFFCGGTAGVFANAEGGFKGCVIGSFLHGIFISLLSLAVLAVLGNLNVSGTTFSDADFCMVGILLGNLAKVFSGKALLAGSILVFFLPMAIHRIRQKGKQV